VAIATARWVLPQPGWPRNRTGRHEPQRGEVVDEAAVDGRLELEVELGDRLAEREPGVTQPGREPPVPGRRCLFGDEPGEELDVGEVVGACGLGKRGEHLDRPVHLQVAEIVLDLLVDAGAHDRSPCS
jgi:hypothetical protein